MGGETERTLRLHPLELIANDRRAAAFLRVTAERAGRRLDIVMAEAIEFDEAGRVREFWAHANDQAAVGRFGSGWAWLAMHGGKLEVYSTPNQDSPVMEGKKVVLSMLVVGLVFLAVILLGDLSHYAAARRRRSKLDRPL